MVAKQSPTLAEAAKLLDGCPAGEIVASAVTRAVVGKALPAGYEWRSLASRSRGSAQRFTPA
ncbi:MAG: hypothetical protein ABR609_10455 [Acidimicrobiia bacterium]